MATLLELYERLMKERERLLNDVDQLKADTHLIADRREGSPFGKREEEASEAFELEKRLALEKRARDLLADVEHALSKYEAGKYGLCEKCGQSIDLERLEALPQAKLCLTCKIRQSKEIKGKLTNQG